MRANFLILITVCLFSVGCTFNTTKRNRESDKADGNKVANAFYSLMSEDKFNEAEKLFGKEFLAVTKKEQLQAIFKNTRSKLGRFKSNKLISAETLETWGSENKTQYVMKYEIEYEKDKSVETIVLIKHDKGPIKIMGYHVSSDILMK